MDGIAVRMNGTSVREARTAVWANGTAVWTSGTGVRMNGTEVWMNGTAVWKAQTAVRANGTAGAARRSRRSQKGRSDSHPAGRVAPARRLRSTRGSTGFTKWYWMPASRERRRSSGWP
jgi:hypothetical protein